jgi:hypothetical protein
VWEERAVPVRAVIDREADVREEGARRLRLLVAEYTDEERETWAQQVEEARAYTLSPLASTPLLTALAEQRTETVPQLAHRILEKDAEYRAGAGAILSAQGALLQMEQIPDDYTDDSYWSAP